MAASVGDNSSSRRLQSAMTPTVQVRDGMVRRTAQVSLRSQARTLSKLPTADDVLAVAAAVRWVLDAGTA
jgi:hypothetical protein